MATFAQCPPETIIARLRELFAATPLHESPWLCEQHHARILLKREDLTPVRSYKVRGAVHFIAGLSESERARGVVCASAGNHAQGVAYACNHFGIRGTIFMPVTTPGQKIERTRIIGNSQVEVTLVGDAFDQTDEHARSHAAENGGVFVPPFDHPAIIEGQSTIAVEILEQMRGDAIDILILPVGGGGLAAGVTEVFQKQSPSTRIVYAEPVVAYSAPSERSTALFELHAGIKVAITGTGGKWREIALLDGKSGWVPEETLRPL